MNPMQSPNTGVGRKLCSPSLYGKGPVSNDLLAPFREIAAGCSERECIEILEDCDDPEIRPIYERRLRQLSNRRVEVEHYEAKFSKG